MIMIEIDDRNLRRALADLQRRVSDMTPAMHAIGEVLVERAKQRFETSTDPAGKPWKPNSPVTILAYLTKYKGSFRKDGSLSKRGAVRAASKKPLIGETGQLATQIHYRASRNAVEVGSSMKYAAVQQFGGKAGAFGRTRRGAKIPWGDIPARPFLPVTESGQFYGEEDRNIILDIIRKRIADG